MSIAMYYIHKPDQGKPKGVAQPEGFIMFTIVKGRVYLYMYNKRIYSPHVT